MKTCLKGPPTNLKVDAPLSSSHILSDDTTTPQKAVVWSSHGNTTTSCAAGEARPNVLNEGYAPLMDLSSSSTGLWGIWEMWCDFPQKPPKQGHHHHTTMTEKLALYQPPNWLDSVRSIGLFDTAEGFWGIHDCTLPPSRLPNGSNYYLFRHNVAPMWEQEANRRGGKWVAQYTCDQSNDVDRAWTELAVAVIGETLPGPEEEICGICVAKRKSGYKISLWTRTADDKSAQMLIGAFIKSLLCVHQQKPTSPSSGLPPLKYLRHCETLEACSSPLQTKERGTSPITTSSPVSSVVKDLSPSSPVAQQKIPEALYSV